MSHLRVLIIRVADEKQPEQTTELHRIDLPAPDPSPLVPETALDHLEAATLDTGQTVLRHLLVDQWQELDQLLVAAHQQLFPLGDVQLDGFASVKVASRLGTLHLPRQVCYHPATGRTRCLAMRSYRPTAG